MVRHGVFLLNVFFSYELFALLFFVARDVDAMLDFWLLYIDIFLRYCEIQILGEGER